MAKRFTDSTIWEDDWFYELTPEHKLFWFYLKDNCNHAGIWKPKRMAFKSVTDTDIDLNKVLESFNNGKKRIRVLENGYWLLEDFFYFQYVTKGKVLNRCNRVHESVLVIYVKMGITLSSIKGLDYIKDKMGIFKVNEYEKSIDIFDLNIGDNIGLNIGGNEGLKDKDKDMDKEEELLY